MVRALTDIFIEEKNKRENKPIFLYEVFDYDGNGNNLRFAEYTEPVEFGGGLPYNPFSITFESMGEQTGGEIDEVKLTLGNVSRLIQYYLETYEFRGKKIRIIQVFADMVDHPDSYLEFIYYIDRWDQPDSKNIIFYLSSKFNIRDVKLPKRVVTRGSCRWGFKSDECGYEGAAVTCKRTLQRCEELLNDLRFGGFPAAGGRKIWL